MSDAELPCLRCILTLLGQYDDAAPWDNNATLYIDDIDTICSFMFDLRVAHDLSDSAALRRWFKADALACTRSRSHLARRGDFGLDVGYAGRLLLNLILKSAANGPYNLMRRAARMNTRREPHHRWPPTIERWLGHVTIARPRRPSVCSLLGPATLSMPYAVMPKLSESRASSIRK